MGTYFFQDSVQVVSSWLVYEDVVNITSTRSTHFFNFLLTKWRRFDPYYYFLHFHHFAAHRRWEAANEAKLCYPIWCSTATKSSRCALQLYSCLAAAGVGHCARYYCSHWARRRKADRCCILTSSGGGTFFLWLYPSQTIFYKQVSPGSISTWNLLGNL